MTQKTFDGMTGGFIGAVAQSLPRELTGDQMKFLIDNPSKLKSALAVLTKTVVATAISLLVLVGQTVHITASGGEFVATKKLVVNVTPSAELKISLLGGNFQNWFLGKVEPAFAGSQLKVQKLSKNSVDQPILDELGGEEKAETSLYEMYEFLKTAEKRWHIFYIKDKGERLRAVFVIWSDGGWDLDADALHGPDDWSADRHVVSRNLPSIT